MRRTLLNLLALSVIAGGGAYLSRPVEAQVTVVTTQSSCTNPNGQTVTGECCKTVNGECQCGPCSVIFPPPPPPPPPPPGG